MKLVSAIYNGVRPFNHMGFTDAGAASEPHQLRGADALVVWGGADIHPTLYNQLNSHSHVGAVPSPRDVIEWGLMRAAIKYGMPIIGVCRGGQMLCAAAGGTLYQHVDNHASGRHNAITIDGKTIEVSSLHHQMMNPQDTEHQLLMWSEHKRSAEYKDANGVYHEPTTKLEPEYIYFPKIKGHAIQWHPEFHSHEEACNVWLADRLKGYLNG